MRDQGRQVAAGPRHRAGGAGRGRFSRLRFAAFALAGLLLWAPPVAAQDLRSGGEATVAEIVDGDTLVLDDGRTVRLVGIQAPKLPLGRPGFVAQPLADDAKTALETLTFGSRVSLSYGGRQTDRYGRELAHLHLDTGVWVRGELLRLGFARVYSFADNRALIAEMLALEGAARAAGLGIWASDSYRVRTVAETPALIDRFELVEGEVVDTALVRGRGYLNFGPDYRTDFTVSIAPRDMRAFRDAGLGPESYAGRRVRVRG